MTPIEYLQWVHTSEAYKYRVVWISILLSLRDSVPENPVEAQIAFFKGQHHAYDGTAWLPIGSPVKPVGKQIPPFLPHNTPITLPAGSFPNVSVATDTMVGNVLVNILCVIHPFGSQIPFLTGKVTAKRIESLITPLLVDDGKEGITVSMYEQYIKAVRMLMGLSGLFVASATRRNTLPPPGVEAFKKQLLKKYDLTDTLQQAQFNNELIKYDEEYLKGDPSLGIVMSGKSKNKARIKLYSAFGIEATFGTGQTTRYIPQGLVEGIPTDKDTFAEVFTAMRASSWFRGRGTVVGGVLSKLFARITAESKLIDTDCGTKVYLPFKIRKSSVSLLDRNLVINGKAVLITKEVLAQYHGLTLPIRSPAHCTLPGTQVCRVCAGEKLFKVKDGIRIASQSVSGNVLGLMLSIFHGINRDSTYIPFDDIAY